MPSKNPLAVAYTKLYDCLQFLENPVLRTILIIVLVIYNSSLIPVINNEVSKFLNIGIIKLLVVIVIVLFAMRDPVLAILLAMALVISTCLQIEGMDNKAIKVYHESRPQDHTEEEVRENMTNQSKEDSHNNEHTEEHLMKLKEEQKETFDNPTQNSGPAGYNIKPNCITKGTASNPLCIPVQTFNPELNAQGLNKPQGYGGRIPGSPW